MYNHKPIVFISSTIRDLKPHREAVHKMIKCELGWRPWCSEIDGLGEASNSLEVCDHWIRKADLVICLLGKEYGTELACEPISFTEWELYRAILYGKEIKVYIKRLERGRHKRLLSLFQVMRDELIGYFFTEFSSKAELVTRVKEYLAVWRPSKTKLVIQKIIGDPELSTSLKHLGSNIFAFSPPIKISFERNFIDEKMKQLAEQHKNSLYSPALNTAVEIFFYLISGCPPEIAKRDDLELWANFLAHFYNILAVTNRLQSGIISAVTLAKALFDIHLRLGDKVGMISSAQCLSGVLNMAGRHDDALLWNDYALERLAYDKRVEASIRDSRGSILRAQGNFKEAQENLWRAAMNFKGADHTLGYILARLVGTQLKSKRKEDKIQGVKNLELADRYAFKPRLSRVKVIQERVRYLIDQKEFREAKKCLKEGISICDKLGLDHPREAMVNLAISKKELKDLHLLEKVKLLL